MFFELGPELNGLLLIILQERFYSSVSINFQVFYAMLAFMKENVLKIAQGFENLYVMCNSTE